MPSIGTMSLDTSPVRDDNSGAVDATPTTNKIDFPRGSDSVRGIVNRSLITASLNGDERFEWSPETGLRVCIPLEYSFESIERASPVELRNEVLSPRDARGKRYQLTQQKQPDTRQEKSRAWWVAQLVHYGLPVSKEGNGAEESIKHTILRDQLVVPQRLVELERRLKRAHTVTTATGTQLMGQEDEEGKLTQELRKQGAQIVSSSTPFTRKGQQRAERRVLSRPDEAADSTEGETAGSSGGSVNDPTLPPRQRRKTARKSKSVDLGQEPSSDEDDTGSLVFHSPIQTLTRTPGDSEDDDGSVIFSGSKPKPRPGKKIKIEKIAAGISAKRASESRSAIKSRDKEESQVQKQSLDKTAKGGKLGAVNRSRISVQETKGEKSQSKVRSESLNEDAEIIEISSEATQTEVSSSDTNSDRDAGKLVSSATRRRSLSVPVSNCKAFSSSRGKTPPSRNLMASPIQSHLAYSTKKPAQIITPIPSHIVKQNSATPSSSNRNTSQNGISEKRLLKRSVHQNEVTPSKRARQTPKEGVQLSTKISSGLDSINPHSPQSNRVTTPSLKRNRVNVAETEEEEDTDNLSLAKRPRSTWTSVNKHTPSRPTIKESVSKSQARTRQANSDTKEAAASKKRAGAVQDNAGRRRSKRNAQKKTRA